MKINNTVIWVVAQYSNYIGSDVPASGSINIIEWLVFEVNSGESHLSHYNRSRWAAETVL